MQLTVRGRRATLQTIVPLAKSQPESKQGASTRPGSRALGSDDVGAPARQPGQVPLGEAGPAPAHSLVQAPARLPMQYPAGLPGQDDLPYSDGEPLESEQHVLGMQLLISSLKPWLRRRFAGTDKAGYVGGNMFLYFSPEQVKNRHFRGPDCFVALGVEPGVRKSWVVWEEGKTPDLVIELLSESTKKTDKQVKPRVYRDEVGVREYYWFDPFNPDDFAGFAFSAPGPDDEADREDTGELLEPNLAPDADGRLTSALLGLRLGVWKGCYEGVDANWLRWYTPEGELLLTEEARCRAEEARRADEQARLKAEEARRADEQARLKEEAERRADEQARLKAEEARRADEQARLKEEAERRADKLAETLRELGLDPDGML